MDEETDVCVVVVGFQAKVTEIRLLASAFQDQHSFQLPYTASSLPRGGGNVIKASFYSRGPQRIIYSSFCYMLAAIPLEGSPAKPNPRLRLQSESQSCLIVLGRTLAKSSPEEDQQRRWRMQELSAGKIALSLTAPNTLQGQGG